MSLRKRNLDGAEIFRIYWEQMGEARSLRTLAEKFPRSSTTGKRITKDAGYKSMWRWACRPENEELSYKIFRRTAFGRDPEWTKERWHSELAEKARWALTPRQYRDWYAQADATEHQTDRVRATN